MIPGWRILNYLHDMVGRGVVDRWTVPARRRALARQKPTPQKQRKKRLYIDVSVISRADAGTGIQRIVRALALELNNTTNWDWDLHFVSADRKNAYRAIAWPASSPFRQRAEPIAMQAGDVFLGLDYCLREIVTHRQQLRAMKAAGGQFCFMTYDLLPLQHPEWFSDRAVYLYRKWLTLAAELADSFLCISEQTERELKAVLLSYFRISDCPTAVLPMGSDIDASLHSQGYPPAFPAWLDAMAQRKYILMVGTIEPRKGHLDILRAFEKLWQEGSDVPLVIVGRPGWKVDNILKMLSSHPERDRNLFWLDDLSDEALISVYGNCQGVVIGALAEGYGLPLLEALGYGKPVLARDLDIFRVHERRGVEFFPAHASTDEIASALIRWIEQIRLGKIQIKSEHKPWKDAVSTFQTLMNMGLS